MSDTVLVPELPEVEQFRRFFRRHAVGKTVATVWADPTILRNSTPTSIQGALRGHAFNEPDRHGKWLTCWTDGPAVLFHFGMTGEFVWSEDDRERHRWDRLAIRFSEGGELRYRNMRKLGGVWLAHDEGDAALIRGSLGPDALAIGQGEFVKLLDHRRGGVKSALMDQSFVAGVGNIIADETLWQARINPRTRIDVLTEADRRRLYRTMRSVLEQAVEGYDSIDRKRSWLSHVRDRPGAVCPRCGTPLARTMVAGRTTYSCPRCQPDVR